MLFAYETAAAFTLFSQIKAYVEKSYILFTI